MKIISPLLAAGANQPGNKQSVSYLKGLSILLERYAFSVKKHMKWTEGS
jgi:hypothetical protein